MEKIIAPRGSGRTYRICKYAIENDCDIIVPALSSIQHIVTIIMQICMILMVNMNILDIMTGCMISRSKHGTTPL